MTDPMTELHQASAEIAGVQVWSPAAQAVRQAANNVFDQAGTTEQGIAAALRAAADQPYEVPAHVQGDSYWAFRNGADAKRARLLALAAELDPEADHD